MTFLPLWMEILVNVIGYAGFIGIATFWIAGALRSGILGVSKFFYFQPTVMGQVDSETAPKQAKAVAT